MQCVGSSSLWRNFVAEIKTNYRFPPKTSAKNSTNAIEVAAARANNSNSPEPTVDSTLNSNEVVVCWMSRQSARERKVGNLDYALGLVRSVSARVCVVKGPLPSQLQLEGEAAAKAKASVSGPATTTSSTPVSVPVSVRVVVLDFNTTIPPPPYREQGLLAEQCDVMIGVYGAGMMHSMYMRSGGSVLEIHPLKFPVMGYYKHIAHLTGLSYLSAHSTRHIIAAGGSLHPTANVTAGFRDVVLQAVTAAVQAREHATTKNFSLSTVQAC